MSLESWKEEFYPVEAIDVLEEDALEHSLLKWMGTLPENCDKHGVIWDNYWQEIRDDKRYFCFDGGSCALCFYYNNCDDYCLPCPLYKLNGNRCDSLSRNGPYFDNYKMIDALKMAKSIKGT